MSGEAFLGGAVTLHVGDSRNVLRELPDASIDSVVTDPPYALVSIVKRFGGQGAAPATGDVYARASAGFMGKQWDTGETAFAPEFWAQVLRVLKPGGHVVAASGTRTYHRLACAVEGAGFEIRDMVSWLYGSGFPKSHDVSKGIDKSARRDFVQAAIDLGLSIPGNNLHDWTKAEHAPGNQWWSKFKSALNSEQWSALERHVVGYSQGRSSAPHGGGQSFGAPDAITTSATPEAAAWNGWGTALKPACEPWVLARKPLVGTVAGNVLTHGTGALNIDGCRVEGGEGGAREGEASAERRYTERGSTNFAATPGPRGGDAKGRWPANVVHDGSEEVVRAFPQTPGQQGDLQATGRARPSKTCFGDMAAPLAHAARGDSGSAARFFYSAKADADDRAGSSHPTVKPVDLMQYLCRLITPPGGVVLDPFAGSGSTGEAAWREGFRAVLVEREPDYAADIRRRLDLATAGERSKRRAIAKVKNKPKPLDGDLFS